MTNQQPYDALIIGGSYAGLSAALVLGRALRRVRVIDAGEPCNRQTPHSHSFLTRDGETPARLSAIAREQVSHYPTVEVRFGTVIRAEPTADGFRVTTATGESASGRKLLLATGVVDTMPDLPGFADCWGRSVLHCPYCHGYEVHGQPLGILANGATAYEMATLIQQWSRHLTLFTDGPATLDADQRQLLDQLQIPIVEKPVAALEHEAGQLTALRFTDGSLAQPNALFARVPFRQSSDLATQLGCRLTESGLLDVSEFGETNVPGVFAVGDATTPFRQVAIAVANGVKAAAWINRELTSEALGLTA
ncbi:NAD(P)/FAD-dependent oxidoreductase [Fibrella sp. WM1]|uniref:NAD(P)/FAD-dependent oxidoreductase n=1 Tax=Fibrella musci TaxID=3242485 RepID=UPI00352180A3